MGHQHHLLFSFEQSNARFWQEICLTYVILNTFKGYSAIHALIINYLIIIIRFTNVKSESIDISY